MILKQTRKKKKTKRTGKFIVLFLVVFLCFWYIQNFTFQITETTVPTEKVTEEITIVQISDLHGASYGNNNKRLVKAIKKQNPDMICITGDMFTNGDTKSMDTALAFMVQLPSIAPVFFVSGEHDREEEYLTALSSAGITVMSYHKQSVNVRGNQIAVYGIDNAYYSDTFNLFYEFDKPSDEAFNLLLAHIPNFDAFNWFGPDLSLCGDTHGGVIQLPFAGPLYFNDRWLPELTSEEEYITDKGLFDTYTGHVYVSGGLGNYPYPIRMFNQPELSVIKLIPKAG
jgi:predicted MPP superfamily phosphohydrolase